MCLTRAHTNVLSPRWLHDLNQLIQGDPESKQVVNIISFYSQEGNDIDDLRTFWITLYNSTKCVLYTRGTISG